MFLNLCCGLLGPQIGEGIENSWGHLEDSEKEDEDEGGNDEAVILDGIKMDPGVDASLYCQVCDTLWLYVMCIYIHIYLEILFLY